MTRRRLIIRAIGESIASLWEIGDEADRVFVPWAAGTSDAVLRMLVARERARTPSLVVEDRRCHGVRSMPA